MKKRIIVLLALAALLLPLFGCAAAGEGKSYPVEEYRTTMQYYDDFKVMQLTDLHFGIETDVALQLRILTSEIREEQPDLIVLTGDNFMYASKGVVNSLVSALNEVCKEITAERKGRLTKFTMTFGNHDNQGDYPRYYINQVISSYATEDGREITDGKFAAFVDYEDDSLFGLTNFYIDLVDDRTKPRDTVDVKYRLHIIDSNTYHFKGPGYGYDVIHGDQLDHAQKIYSEATADKSYVGMAFFHIPFYEYEDAGEEYKNAADPSAIGRGEYREGISYAYENNGSFEKLRRANIVAFFCGHDHVNCAEIIYRADDPAMRSILSYGVKGTNQLYHDKDLMGYKVITLRDITAEEFVSMKNIEENIKNVTGGYSNYENK